MTAATHFDVVVLGAGPGGLTAAYRLARDGARVVVVERAERTGGLMAGIRRGAFSFDLGRKELFCRLPDVHDLWTELLGDDYRVYPHHVGWLFGGRIIERLPGPRGPMRGMSAAQAGRLALSFLWSQVRPGPRRATNLEDDYLLRYGRGFYETYVHGYQAKFHGFSPRLLPPPFGDEDIPRFAFLKNRLDRLRGVAPPPSPAHARTRVWRHPARGTQQIVDALEVGARAASAAFVLGAEVLSVDVGDPGPHRVVIRDAAGERALSAAAVISGLPRPVLLRLLRPAPPADLRTPPRDDVVYKRSVLLVYVLADEPPRFPHNWLEVNDRSLRVGRVVNYATWNGAMVPPGKTGLCLEYFCLDSDPEMRLGDADLMDLASAEAVRGGLVGGDHIFDRFVVRLPQANAANFLADFESEWMVRVSRHLADLPRFYDTNRPGTDYATMAGLDAAAACRTGRTMSSRSLVHVEATE